MATAKKAQNKKTSPQKKKSSSSVAKPVAKKAAPKAKQATAKPKAAAKKTAVKSELVDSGRENPELAELVKKAEQVSAVLNSVDEIATEAKATASEAKEQAAQVASVVKSEVSRWRKIFGKIFKTSK